MRDYNFGDLSNILKSDVAPIVLYGAGTIGLLAYHALTAIGIKVDCFCDSDDKKQGELCCWIKTISPEELEILNRDTRIFLCNNYFNLLVPRLERLGFKNIYSCVALLENTDFRQINLGMPSLTINRQIALHKSSYFKFDTTRETLDLKYVDIIITERCSLRCRDCSNLMQYYVKPKNCDLTLLFESVDKLMTCVDSLQEFRVIGGEPFMNQELSKIVNKLATYKNANCIIIYTNGTILPTGENLACLKNKKVVLEITNYGRLSRNFDRMLEVFKACGIKFITNNIEDILWDDCATIRYQEKSKEEVEKMFMDCCVNDVISLLHGRLYRCPISAHATNLNAIPFNENDIIDLAEDITIEELKKKIKFFYKDKCYISACYYCQGRTYDGRKIIPGIQAKEPLSLSEFYAPI